MAAFRQDHRTGLLAITPVSADIRMCHVPKRYILPMIHIDNIAKQAALDDFPHLLEMSRVPQHMTDVQLSAGQFTCRHQLSAIRFVGCHRFFQ